MYRAQEALGSTEFLRQTSLEFILDRFSFVGGGKGSIGIVRFGLNFRSDHLDKNPLSSLNVSSSSATRLRHVDVVDLTLHADHLSPHRLGHLQPIPLALFEGLLNKVMINKLLSPTRNDRWYRNGLDKTKTTV